MEGVRVQKIDAILGIASRRLGTRDMHYLFVPVCTVHYNYRKDKGKLYSILYHKLSFIYLIANCLYITIHYTSLPVTLILSSSVGSLR